MGGVIRTQKALKIFREGNQDPQKIYVGGDMKWDKPIPSAYPINSMSPSDDVLFVGSSDLACLTYSCWYPRYHDWPNVFRTNYTGSMQSMINGQTRYGMKSANTLGRAELNVIIANAENGQYGDANPFTHMADFDALVIDTSDTILSDYRAYEYQNAPDFYALTQLPTPFQWPIRHGFQKWLNNELRDRMKLIRAAHTANVRKIYLTVPWPRLNTNGAAVSAQDIVNWYNNKFANLEQSMHYQQDRLNYQIEAEGLGTHVNLIPFHLVLKRIYEDIRDGNAPAALTDIRMLFAGDNTSMDDPVTISGNKHWYMLNYWGGYAINALFAAVVYGNDPRGASNTDGYFTVPQPVATYFQNLAWDIAHSYGRAGRTRDNLGYIAPKIRNWEPEQILGNDLVGHVVGPTNHTASYPLARPSHVAHLMALVDIDTANFQPGEFVSVVNALGSSTDSAFMQLWLDGSTLAGQGGVRQGGVEFATFNHLPLVGGGTVRIMLDAQIPHPGYLDKLGMNCMIQAIQPSVPYDQWQGPFSAHGASITPGALSPILNRIVTPNQYVRGVEIIACSRAITDGERFNLYRYLSRKYQLQLWEPVYPDMVP